MGKSSASLKRKRSKSSSKAKASRRSKRRKYRSKKLRPREVPLSSSDYDDSQSLSTSTSSSSQDSYRRRRARSRTRKDVKGRRKRARRHSYSRDSSEDSLHARKMKKEKRKNEYQKPYQKKKLRKEANASSMRSGSWSCSTCQGGSASSDDSEFESRRRRLERKKKDKRRLERGRSGSGKSSRYRARSCSSCSPCSESDDEVTEEKYIGENNSRRLRSVITATREVEEGKELCRNETEEEIVDDHDYPCRSNDSNDGAIKRELDYHILPASEEKLRVEDEKGDVYADFNFTEPKIRDMSYNDRSNLKAYGTGTSQSIEKKTSETSGANLNDGDLESILRQRALENLRKFRGGIQSTVKASDQKNKIDSDVKQPIIEKHELVQGKSIFNNAAVGTQFDKKTLVEETNFPSRNNGRISNVDKCESGSAKHHSTCASENVIDADNPSETITASSSYRTNNTELSAPESLHDSLQSLPSLKQTPVSGLPQEKLLVAESTQERHTFEAAHFVSRITNDNVKNIRGMSSAGPKPFSSPGPKFKHNSLNKGQDEVKEHSPFELKQTFASHEHPHAKSLVTEGDVENNAPKTAQTTIQSINNSGGDVDTLCNSATSKPSSESPSVEKSSNKLQDESNQTSQFEQKTMNVMRGGEMVQVSYKVYIPKKAPALVRRQLKR